MKQTTSCILMVEPVNFAFNEQTAGNNYFQQKESSLGNSLQEKAFKEFWAMVEKLRSKNIEIITIQDTHTPPTPDSIFPNNWISFHANGKVALYPMFAENRRWERRQDILDTLKSKGFQIKGTVDYSDFENQHIFLEGTGSMILDRGNKIAYAAISERTNKELFYRFCAEFEYTPVAFSANQWAAANQRLPIYHTNVMMCVAQQYAVVCLSTIDNAEERTLVEKTLTKYGKEIVEISETQMHHFAGNMLQIENREGVQFLVMSQTAYHSLSEQQLSRLAFYNEIISVEIPTIEKIGGGSARCMMAEVFLEKKMKFNRDTI